MGIVAVVVIVIGSLAALAYVWRIIEPLYFGEPASPSGASTRTEAPPLMLVALALAAAANIYFGLVPEVPVSLSELAAELLLENKL
jgi:multicomponent Na+:H+ antiporter subunit D